MKLLLAHLFVKIYNLIPFDSYDIQIAKQLLEYELFPENWLIALAKGTEPSAALDEAVQNQFCMDFLQVINPEAYNDLFEHRKNKMLKENK